jgi:hypothetical protein
MLYDNGERIDLDPYLIIHKVCIHKVRIARHIFSNLLNFISSIFFAKDCFWGCHDTDEYYLICFDIGGIDYF